MNAPKKNNAATLKARAEKAQAALLNQSASVRKIEALLRSATRYRDRLSVEWSEAVASLHTSQSEISNLKSQIGGRI